MVVLPDPVGAASASQLIRDASEMIVPPLARDSILIALRDIACGDIETTGSAADPAPMVREHAAEVLARIGSAVARRAAVARLWDPIDPRERDADVRRQLARYLGTVGNPTAFEACVRRLGDVDSGVRYHAYSSLRTMTGARVGSTAKAWKSWRKENARWQLPADSSK